jgi:general secretion pathway protein G
MEKRLGFTLVEILIMVVLLGILAGIIIPMIGRSTTSAQEAALLHDVQEIRRCVLIYQAQHLDVSPGYPNGDKSQVPTEAAFVAQITQASKMNGQTAAPGTAGFSYGPYLMRIPINSFNKKMNVQVLGDGDAFGAAADNSSGWIYKPATSELRLNNSGSDGNKQYYDY